ncbi:kelch repeat protein [Niveomyces insectorum RCEF 264]|uniref:Kelch repeat protein n=1 Tax=Niveomyces insectorum RCEF 264 TaxID=1081102 RepID=A0A167VH95_9HYPO|nr:kelch repeat protein [Niveomyces insectorum RCEF 264]
MAKDKKTKSEGKKAKAAEKKQKQEKKAEKKAKTKTARQQQDGGSDAEDVDLDQVLAEYKRQQELFLKVTETVAPAPPPARAAACFLASPTHANQLLLFGGEYFNGALATFFNDLHIYYTDRDEWRTVTSPNAPLPRSGHAWCRGGNQSDAVFLFGGEFSSPKQGTFYHYNDFWRLDPAAREWTRLDAASGGGQGKARAPPARSGHRMTYFKNYIVLFGGFQDTAQQTRYLADLWLYDTAQMVWFNPALPPAQLKPDARSSFTLLPHEQGAVLYGGFSRVKTAVGGGGGGGGGGGKSQHQQHGRTTMKAVVHQDCFFLRITPPTPAEAAAGAPPVVRWERRKKPANTPNPPQSEEGLESEFFNQLFAWNIERNRFFPLTLRKPRTAPSNRAAANEEELLRQLAALEATSGAKANGGDDDDDDDDSDKSDDKPREKNDRDEAPARQMPVSMEMPHPRFNALLAVQGDVLYMYGGTYEKGDREFTFDDLYAIDLGKLDGCKEVFSRPLDDTWIDSEEEDEDEDDEDEDEEEEDEEDVEMEDQQDAKPKKFTPSTRKKTALADAEAASAASAAAAAAELEEADTDTADTTVDDGLPHPRPFESRRDFFNRTSKEWQEVLLANLRGAGAAGMEVMTIKELKTKAFELSEEKWWDCREEITALEDEQEEAGIGEVVSLADRAGTGAGTGGGGAGQRRR